MHNCINYYADTEIIQAQKFWPSLKNIHGSHYFKANFLIISGSNKFERISNP
jgi:hypothetical protein